MRVKYFAFIIAYKCRSIFLKFSLTFLLFPKYTKFHEFHGRCAGRFWDKEIKTCSCSFRLSTGDCLKAECAVLERMAMKFKQHKIAIWLDRGRISDAWADKSDDKGIAPIQFMCKNAVGSKLDLFQAKNQAATVWTEVPAAYPSAGITAPLHWRTEMLIIGLVDILFGCYISNNR